jgi:ATP-dependent Clp protease ATP-binding subunit ClpB
MQIEKYMDRPLKRVIQRQLQNPLAKMLLPGGIVDGETVRVTVADGQLAVNGRKLAQAA